MKRYSVLFIILVTMLLASCVDVEDKMQQLQEYKVPSHSQEECEVSDETNSPDQLTESEAEEALKKFIGNLGTWVEGDENVLVLDDIYTVDGKDYYQFSLKGRVGSHLTTLTWYVISTDGTEIFEGQCNNGYLDKY